MNFKLENDEQVNHFITVGDVKNGEFSLTVLRVPPLGGIPKRIVVQMPEESSYIAVIKKVQHLAKLDNDIFTMLSNHNQAEEE